MAGRQQVEAELDKLERKYCPEWKLYTNAARNFHRDDGPALPTSLYNLDKWPTGTETKDQYSTVYKNRQDGSSRASGRRLKASTASKSGERPKSAVKTPPPKSSRRTLQRVKSEPAPRGRRQALLSKTVGSEPVPIDKAGIKSTISVPGIQRHSSMSPKSTSSPRRRQIASPAPSRSPPRKISDSSDRRQAAPRVVVVEGLSPPAIIRRFTADADLQTPSPVDAFVTAIENIMDEDTRCDPAEAVAAAMEEDDHSSSNSALSAMNADSFIKNSTSNTDKESKLSSELLQNCKSAPEDAAQDTGQDSEHRVNGDTAASTNHENSVKVGLNSTVSVVSSEVGSSHQGKEIGSNSPTDGGSGEGNDDRSCASSTAFTTYDESKSTTETSKTAGNHSEDESEMADKYHNNNQKEEASPRGSQNRSAKIDSRSPTSPHTIRASPRQSPTSRSPSQSSISYSPGEPTFGKLPGSPVESSPLSQSRPSSAAADALRPVPEATNSSPRDVTRRYGGSLFPVPPVPRTSPPPSHSKVTASSPLTPKECDSPSVSSPLTPKENNKRRRGNSSTAMSSPVESSRAKRLRREDRHSDSSASEPRTRTQKDQKKTTGARKASKTSAATAVAKFSKLNGLKMGEKYDAVVKNVQELDKERRSQSLKISDQKKLLQKCAVALAQQVALKAMRIHIGAVSAASELRDIRLTWSRIFDLSIKKTDGINFENIGLAKYLLPLRFRVLAVIKQCMFSEGAPSRSSKKILNVMSSRDGFENKMKDLKKSSSSKSGGIPYYQDYTQWARLAVEAEALWARSKKIDRAGSVPPEIDALIKQKVSQDTVHVKPRFDTLAEAILEAVQIGLNAGSSGAGDKCIEDL